VSLPVRRYIASKADIKAIKFIITYPLPSSKKAVLAYLGIPLTPSGQPEAPIPITRKAKVDVCAMALPMKDAHGLTVLRCVRKLQFSIYEDLIYPTTPQISVQGFVACEKIVKSDVGVQQMVKEFNSHTSHFFIGVLPEQIVCDGWSISYDDCFPQKRHIQQASISAQLLEHGNLYAHSLVSA
ncbi:hypothetical protein EV421DRAFT_1717212, partial [Armillaria borealis]